MILGSKAPCDFHTRYQQIATVDEATGDLVERRWVPHPFACFAKGACSLGGRTFRSDITRGLSPRTFGAAFLAPPSSRKPKALASSRA
jgi:hypothetical protein